VSPNLLCCPCVLWPALVLGATAYVLLGMRMRTLGADTDVSPPPRQVTLELAWTPRAAERLIRAWAEIGCSRVRRQISLDFALILGYLLAGSAATLLAAREFARSAPSLSGLSKLALVFWVVAAALDVLENVLLLKVLPPTRLYRLQAVASACATIKFALVALGAAYPLTALTVFLVRLTGLKL
jgi:hypothetical protein